MLNKEVNHEEYRIIQENKPYKIFKEKFDKEFYMPIYTHFEYKNEKWFGIFKDLWLPLSLQRALDIEKFGI